MLLLGPLGPGVIVIHDHQAEDLHAHKVHPGSGGQAVAGNGHDHPTDTVVDLEGAQFVLHPPRPAAILYTGSGVRSPGETHAAHRCYRERSAPEHGGICCRPWGWTLAGQRQWRRHDTMTSLLLGGHSLLI